MSDGEMTMTSMSEDQLRAHDLQRTCEHAFIPKQVCSKCGWQASSADILNQLLVLWERATYDEHLNFLKRVTIK